MGFRSGSILLALAATVFFSFLYVAEYPNYCAAVLSTTLWEESSSSTSSSSLPLYDLDNDEPLSKYHVDVSTGVRKVGSGDRWIPNRDKFYDSPADVRNRYSAVSSSALPKSTHYKAQEGEDKFMLQTFFHTPAGRPYYFIELGGFDGVTFSNSYFFDFEKGWNGLLIEGETGNYVKMEQTRGQNPAKNVTTAHLAICP